MVANISVAQIAPYRKSSRIIVVPFGFLLSDVIVQDCIISVSTAFPSSEISFCILERLQGQAALIIIPPYGLSEPIASANHQATVRSEIANGDLVSFLIILILESRAAINLTDDWLVKFIKIVFLDTAVPQIILLANDSIILIGASDQISLSVVTSSFEPVAALVVDILIPGKTAVCPLDRFSPRAIVTPCSMPLTVLIPVFIPDIGKSVSIMRDKITVFVPVLLVDYISQRVVFAVYMGIPIFTVAQGGAV